MSIAYGQAKYWVEFDPSWDYHSLTYAPAPLDLTVRTSLEEKISVIDLTCAGTTITPRFTTRRVVL